MVFKDLEPTVSYLKSHPQECLTLFVESAWPDGYFCPHCESYVNEWPEDGNGRRVRCPGCKRRINIFNNSALEHSNLGLAFWLAIMWNSVATDRCSGHELAELLGCEYSKIQHAIKVVNTVKSQLSKQGAFYRSNKLEVVIRCIMSECCSEP